MSQLAREVLESQLARSLLSGPAEWSSPHRPDTHRIYAACRAMLFELPSTSTASSGSRQPDIILMILKTLQVIKTSDPSIWCTRSPLPSPNGSPSTQRLGWRAASSPRLAHAPVAVVPSLHENWPRLPSAPLEGDVFCVGLSRFQRDELLDLVFLQHALGNRPIVFPAGHFHLVDRAVIWEGAEATMLGC